MSLSKKHPSQHQSSTQSLQTTNKSILRFPKLKTQPQSQNYTKANCSQDISLVESGLIKFKSQGNVIDSYKNGNSKSKKLIKSSKILFLGGSAKEIKSKENIEPEITSFEKIASPHKDTSRKDW